MDEELIDFYYYPEGFMPCDEFIALHPYMDRT